MSSILPATNFSPVKTVLTDLQKSADQGYLKAGAAHLVAPIATVLADVLAALVHTGEAALKATVCVLKTPIFLVYKDVAPWANASDVVEHLKRAAATVPVLVAAPVSLVSFPAAQAIISAVGAGSAEPVKGWWEQFKAKGWKGQISHVGNAVVDGGKGAVSAGAEQAQNVYNKATLKNVGIVAGAVALATEAYRNGAAYWYESGNYGSTGYDTAVASKNALVNGANGAIEFVKGLLPSGKIVSDGIVPGVDSVTP